MLPGKGHTTYFSLFFQEEILVPDFYGFKPSCLHILHTLYRLLLSPLQSIPSQVEVPLLGTYSTYHSIPAPFPMWDVLASSLAVPFMD